MMSQIVVIGKLFSQSHVQNMRVHDYDKGKYVLVAMKSEAGTYAMTKDRMGICQIYSNNH